MARPKFPSDDVARLMLRLPDGLRERIANVAHANNRSMNSEIVSTLEGAYPHPVDKRDIVRALETILERVRQSPEIDLSWHLKMALPMVVETVEAGAILENDIVETEKFSNP